MKISLKWLNDHVDLGTYLAEPAALADKLTFAGLEVEAIEDLSLPYKNVVVGQILNLERHPGADRLTYCQVTTGDGVVHPIVCGATNHKKGDKVVVALPGAVLPGDFKIKESKIRGVESKGMLCSEVELALADKSDGIMILPSEAPVGKSFAAYYGLDDVVFEINVTPNRPDVLSHYGLAREVKALLGKELRPLITDCSDYAVASKTTDKTSVQLESPEACPRYAGIWIQNVKIVDSPDWLKQKLSRVGLKPINNVVDITNYVLWELGQPLHAFDVAKLTGDKIYVDFAKDGEKFVALDESELTLKSEHLTIRDGKGPIALAGVMGGLHSGVTDSTTEIFLESAFFRPKLVRRASRHYGLESDSSYRFSRGVNVEGVVEALKLAARLIGELAGGQVSKEWIDIYPAPQTSPTLQITQDHLSQRLGWTPAAGEPEKIWTDLGFKVKASAEGFEVSAPSYRGDIGVPEDLVEEYARVAGYHNIPEVLPPLAQAPTPQDTQFELSQKARSIWAASGFMEAKNYAFDAGDDLKKFLGDITKLQKVGLQLQTKAATLQNPLSEELNALKPLLSLGVLKNAVYNLRRGRSWGHLFELSPVVYGKTPEGQYPEGTHLAALSWGHVEGLWHGKPLSPKVFELKSALENFLRAFGGKSWSFQQLSAEETPDFLHPSQSASLFYEGRRVGFWGSLHPLIMEEMKIRQPVALLELDFVELCKGQPRVAKFKPISKFPVVERDLAFVLPLSVPAQDVVQCIQKAAQPLCREVRVFDSYQGEAVGEGQKSYAFKMLYQDDTKTLEESAVQSLQDKIIAAVTKNFDASLR